jgi:PAS domain S-box-containing protein
MTERKQLEAQLQAAKVYAESIVDTVREPLVVLEPSLRVKSANRSFYQQFGVQPEATEGRLIYELENQQWNLPELRRLLEEVLPQNSAFNDFMIEHEVAGRGRRTLLLNARRLDEVSLILLAIEDITERQQTRFQSNK